MWRRCSVSTIFAVSHAVFLILAPQNSDSLKCYSCASSEYRALFRNGNPSSRNVRVPKFDRLCDVEDMVQGFAPVESCHSTCVTIFEPQFFGGLQSKERPFLYIRGCADRIFAEMKDTPIEVEFLQRSPICVKLQLSQIYPQVQANEVVQVCSCDTDGCNFDSMNVALPKISFLVIVFVMVYSFVFI